MKKREKDLTRLQHIIEAIELIEEFSEGMNIDNLPDDLKTQSAIIRQFEIIGEASVHLSLDIKEAIVTSIG